jgi:hypothetical protein
MQQPLADMRMELVAEAGDHARLRLVRVPMRAACSVCGAAGSKEAVALFDRLHAVFVCAAHGQPAPVSVMHVFHRGCVEHLLWDADAAAGPCGCALRLAAPAQLCQLDPTRAVLGLDIGNVIRENATGQFVDGAVDAVRQLVAFLGPDRVFLISKAGLPMQAKSRAFLASSDFFQATGVREANLLFCLERVDKAPLCQRLGITHFVDDHVDVLKHLASVEHCLLFRPDDKETLEKARSCPAAITATGWAHALNLLLPPPQSSSSSAAAASSSQDDKL